MKNGLTVVKWLHSWVILYNLKPSPGTKKAVKDAHTQKSSTTTTSLSLFLTVGTGQLTDGSNFTTIIKKLKLFCMHNTVCIFSLFSGNVHVLTSKC